MSNVFEPKKTTLTETTSGETYPVSRIFCIGRNYAAHAREMGRDPDRELPFFFTKWAETIVPSGATIMYPPCTENFHYEAELVIAVGKAGRNIPVESARDYIYGYATGLDMTRRDLQLEAREKGRPWDTGKNVEESSPIGLLHKASDVHDMSKGSIKLTVNGEVKQDGDLAELIWDVEEVVAYISKFYRLEPGDLIYTGTPAGVGPVVTGDEISVTIDGLTACTVKVGETPVD